MPKKPYLNTEHDRYVIIINNDDKILTRECFTASSAVTAYRDLRSVYGDNVRLTKVVLDYGQEI